MNILIFNWRDTRHSWAGGSELYIHELAKRWVKRGNRVVLFCGQDRERKLPEREKIDGIEIVRKGGRFSVYLWAPIFYLKTLRKDIDIVIDVENGIPFFTPFFSLKKKMALVYHVHGKQFFYELQFPFNIVGFCIEKFLFPIFYFNTKIMSISESTKHELIKLGFSASNITIVTPGIVQPPKLYSKRVAKYKTPTLIYLGRIKRYKRVDLLVSMLPEIMKKIPGVRLLIAGWGTEAPQISDIIMKNGYRKNVSIIGPVSEEEKRTLLRKSWLMVNPSLHEGWGISIIEANAYGTPAIAFKVPGLSDAIKDKKTGFLAIDKNDFINKIEVILKYKGIRGRMEKEAQKWSSSLSWDKAAEKSYRFLKTV